MQSFLNFLTHNNALIIQILIGVVCLLVLYLAIRHFFSPNSESNIVSGAATLDTTQIEKSLQKILEAQSKAMVEAEARNAAAPSGEPLTGAGASASIDTAELERLKNEIAQKEKLLAQAREEAAKAEAAAAAAAAQSAAASANKVDDGEARKLQDKVKDLEARLAEYEIISEDIADLSFFKEENQRLQNELSGLKGAGQAGTGTAPEANISFSGGNAAPADNSAFQVTSPPPLEANAPLTVSEPGGVDDDIMKEFAKAVEEQKGAAPAAPPPPAKTDAQENSELMNQFENFVKKG